MTSDQLFTYQTRIKSQEHHDVLLAYSEIMNKVERKLFADYSRGKKPNELKSTYLKDFKITARQYNSVRVQLEGKIASIKEIRKELIHTSKERIVSLEKKIASLEKRSKNPMAVHQKKRSLFLKKARLHKLEQEDIAGIVPLCFGTRKLFRAQFALEENGYLSHEDWLKDWKEYRNNSFFLLGSKDEAAGNQSCTATLQEDGNLTLRLRLPDALVEKFGKYLLIQNIHFAYGHETIISNLMNEETSAICYRFKLDKKGWQIFASTSLKAPKTVTLEGIGAIGIDINADHLEVCEIDRFGNRVTDKKFPLCSYGKSKAQFKAIMGDAAAEIVKWSIASKKPIILEKLSFRKKKTELKEKCTNKLARMLSSFAYQIVISSIKSRAYRYGVEVKEVNPAYTSIIGMVKFAKRYGLSIHASAALCIARRSLKFSEKLPRQTGYFPDGKGFYVTFSLPARNREQHVWKSWAQVRRKVKVAHAAHFQAIKNRSSSRSPAPEMTKSLKLIGEIPIRESSTKLLGWRSTPVH